MQQLAILADYGDLCGESPIWDGKTGTLYWTDCVGLKFYRLQWASARHEVVKQGIEINSFTLNKPGGFVISNNDGIWLWDGHDKIAPVLGEVNGLRCRINDSIADPAGRLFAGSWFYDPVDQYQLGNLIRLDSDGTARIVDEGFHLANGLGFSPDCKTLYFTDSAARRIYAYDYDTKTGNLHNRRVIVKVPEDEGIPDGLTVDAKGFLWSAQWYGGCIVRYDPDGKVERRIAIPAKQISSLTFGGSDLTDNFVTSAAKSEPMPIMPPGYDCESGYFGGQLFHLNLGIQGKVEFKTNLSLKS